MTRSESPLAIALLNHIQCKQSNCYSFKQCVHEKRERKGTDKDNGIYPIALPAIHTDLTYVTDMIYIELHGDSDNADPMIQFRLHFDNHKP